MTAPINTTTTRAATIESRKRDVQIGLLFAVVVITAVATLTVTLLFPEAGEGASTPTRQSSPAGRSSGGF